MATSKIKTRLATVLMPVYNVESYINEAIDSILTQTYSNFDFLIINDCSTDKSEEIVFSYKDERIKYLKNETNLGLAGTLNRGIDNIETKYIIRMDSDDISVPRRIEKLIDFMEANEEIGVYSSGLERFGNDNAIWKHPNLNDDIKAHLLFGPSINHAPCILRTSVLKENKIYYSNNFLHLEDYDLWFRLKDFTKYANTDEVLYKYRVAKHNVTVFYQDSVVERKKQIHSFILNSFGIKFNEEELMMHIALGYQKLLPDAIDVRKYKLWFDKIIKTNKENNYFNHEALVKQVNWRWDKLFFMLSERKFKGVTTYFKISKKIKLSQLIYLLKFGVNKYVLRK